jgi:hypothetical protein
MIKDFQDQYASVEHDVNLIVQHITAASLRSYLKRRRKRKRTSLRSLERSMKYFTRALAKYNPQSHELDFDRMPKLKKKAFEFSIMEVFKVADSLAHSATQGHMDAVDITQFVSHVTARLLHREKATAESMNALVTQIKQQYYEDFQKELLPEIDTFVTKHVNSFIEGKP